MQAAAAQLEGAVEFDFDALVRTCNFPRVWKSKPIIGLFVLPAVPDRLSKNAILVAQTVTHRRELHSRHRVDKTGSKTA